MVRCTKMQMIYFFQNLNFFKPGWWGYDMSWAHCHSTSPRRQEQLSLYSVLKRREENWLMQESRPQAWAWPPFPEVVSCSRLWPVWVHAVQLGIYAEQIWISAGEGWRKQKKGWRGMLSIRTIPLFLLFFNHISNIFFFSGKTLLVAWIDCLWFNTVVMKRIHQHFNCHDKHQNHPSTCIHAAPWQAHCINIRAAFLHRRRLQ